MRTFKFTSEKNWNSVYKFLCDRYDIVSFGYKAITVLSEEAAEELMDFCRKKRISVKEI